MSSGDWYDEKRDGDDDEEEGSVHSELYHGVQPVHPSPRGRGYPSQLEIREVRLPYPGSPQKRYEAAQGKGSRPWKAALLRYGLIPMNMRARMMAYTRAA